MEEKEIKVIYVQHMKGFGVSRSSRNYPSLEEAEAEVIRVHELNEYWISAYIEETSN